MECVEFQRVCWVPVCYEQENGLSVYSNGGAFRDEMSEYNYSRRMQLHGVLEVLTSHIHSNMISNYKMINGHTLHYDRNIKIPLKLM
jgi:hypothetical protein